MLKDHFLLAVSALAAGTFGVLVAALQFGLPQGGQRASVAVSIAVPPKLEIPPPLPPRPPVTVVRTMPQPLWEKTEPEAPEADAPAPPEAVAEPAADPEPVRPVRTKTSRVERFVWPRHRPGVGAPTQPPPPPVPVAGVERRLLAPPGLLHGAQLAEGQWMVSVDIPGESRSRVR